MSKFEDRMTPSLKRIQKELAELPKLALEQFKKETPVRSGNARKNTKLVNGNTVWADYEYASYLEQGRSSQAPKGMTEGVKRVLDAEVRKIVRK